MAKKTTPKRTYVAFRYEENTLKHYLKGQLRSGNIRAKISSIFEGKGPYCKLEEEG